MYYRRKIEAELLPLKWLNVLDHARWKQFCAQSSTLNQALPVLRVNRPFLNTKGFSPIVTYTYTGPNKDSTAQLVFSLVAIVSILFRTGEGWLSKQKPDLNENRSTPMRSSEQISSIQLRRKTELAPFLAPDTS